MNTPFGFTSAVVFGTVLVSSACTMRRGDPVLSTPEHIADVDAWHARRIQRLTEPDGWLALVGLHWLKDGTWTVGSNDSANIPLPAGHAAGVVGSLDVTGDTVNFTPAPDADVRAAGRRLRDPLALRSDAQGQTPTLLITGSVSMHLIKRGPQLGLRVRDSGSPRLHDFHGIERFPVNGAWKLAARFVPYMPAKTMTVPTVVGIPEEQQVPGAVRFTVDNKPYQLDVVQEPGEAAWFVVFSDITAGKETYGAGRFLYVDPPSAGSDSTVIDFNKAFNPPCAFTPFATCPLPTAQNRLPLAVLAGEKIVRHPEG